MASCLWRVLSTNWITKEVWRRFQVVVSLRSIQLSFKLGEKQGVFTRLQSSLRVSEVKCFSPKPRLNFFSLEHEAPSLNRQVGAPSLHLRQEKKIDASDHQLVPSLVGFCCLTAKKFIPGRFLGFESVNSCCFLPKSYHLIIMKPQQYIHSVSPIRTQWVSFCGIKLDSYSSQCDILVG